MAKEKWKQNVASLAASTINTETSTHTNHTRTRLKLIQVTVNSVLINPEEGEDERISAKLDSISYKIVSKEQTIISENISYPFLIEENSQPFY